MYVCIINTIHTVIYIIWYIRINCVRKHYYPHHNRKLPNSLMDRLYIQISICQNKFFKNR